VVVRFEGNLEHGVGSATTTKKQRGYARRSHTEYDETLAADSVANGVVHERLASSARATEEEDLTGTCFGGGDNSVVCIQLLSVELWDTLLVRGSLLITVVVQLLTNQSIFGLTTPVVVWMRHLEACEVLPMFQQDRIEEPKTIVVDVFVLGNLPPRGSQVST
jgi:hypothetical protein